MAFLSNRQSPTQPVSGRATVAHLNRFQQPRPSLLSGRALVGQLGVGRRYTGSNDLLTPRSFSLPEPLLDFQRLRADAQRLQQQLAAQDTLARVSEPALPPTRTPAQAGYPIPFLSPAQQQQRAHERARARAQRQQQVLAAYNRAAQAAFLSPLLRQALSLGSSRISMLAKPKAAPGTQPATGPTGSDCFMPKSFWKSQNPDGKSGWTQCCATCKAMIEKSQGYIPSTWVQIVLEHGQTLVAQKQQATGFHTLDSYVAHKVPVMIGVHFKFGTTYNHDNTTEHFVVIVGSGIEAGKKYYRFFDVGTQFVKKGTDHRNKLYYDESNGSYSGRSYATGHDYTISELRFK